jgi:hypothetical protein
MASPKHPDPTVWDTIFASPLVIVAARVVILSAAIVLLFGGLYIAVSILFRMRNGQWLQRAGPFEAHLAEVGEGEVGDARALRKLYADAVEENTALRALLAKRDRQVKELAS